MKTKGAKAQSPVEGEWQTVRDAGSARAAAAAMPVCVIGCGRSHRRDDQIGLRVTEALQSSPPAHTTLRTSQAPGVDLIADLEGVDLLVVVDAAQATQEFPVGTAARILDCQEQARGRCLLQRDQAAPFPIPHRVARGQVDLDQL